MLACWLDCPAQVVRLFVRSFVGYVTLVAVLIDSFGYYICFGLVLSLWQDNDFLVGFFSRACDVCCWLRQRSPSSRPLFLCEKNIKEFKDMIPARYFHWSTKCSCRSSTVCRKR